MQLELRDLDLLQPDLPHLLTAYRAALRGQRYAEALQALEPCLLLLRRAIGGVLTQERYVELGHSVLLRGWMLGAQARGYLLVSCGQRQAGISELKALLALDAADPTRSRVLLHVLAQEVGDRDTDTDLVPTGAVRSSR